MSTTTAPPTAHAAPTHWNPLPFARHVASYRRAYQVTAVFALALSIVVRLLPGLDNGTFSNICFVFGTLPVGGSVVAAHAILAVERAVLRERGIST